MNNRQALRGLTIMVAFMGVLLAHGQKSKSAEPMNQNLKDYGKGQVYHQQLKFDTAILYYQHALEALALSKNPSDNAIQKQIGKRILECESGKKLIASPREFVIENLGPEINSVYEDYAPVLNGNASLLVFTSRRPNGNINEQKTKEGKYFEDIYYSKNENAKWTVAMNMGPPVNTPFHDSNLALSEDGKQLFLYTDENEGDILYTRWVNEKWTVPQRLPWPINSAYHESSVSVSADGKRLFVASERPGGFGGSDIYMFDKRATGQWSSAVNLGPSINTEWDEDSPFIDYDGVTLYFSSTGHNSMGGHDIFRSQLNQTQWTQAFNLGYPINTPGHDSYFASTRDGKGAYYSSVRAEGFGQEDIYYITLPKELIRYEVNPGTPSLGMKISADSALIYFDYGASDLPVGEQKKLDAFIAEILDCTRCRISIDGHTDNTGLEKSNEALSMARAEAVKSYFLLKGIGADHVTTGAWGASRPAAANDVEKRGRELNRRVEVTVIHN